MSDFKVGDKVYIVSDHPSYADDFQNSFTADMMDYVGNGVEYTISSIVSSGVYFREISYGWPKGSLSHSKSDKVQEYPSRVLMRQIQDDVVSVPAYIPVIGDIVEVETDNESFKSLNKKIFTLTHADPYDTYCTISDRFEHRSVKKSYLRYIGKRETPDIKVGNIVEVILRSPNNGDYVENAILKVTEVIAHVDIPYFYGRLQPSYNVLSASWNIKIKVYHHRVKLLEGVTV